VICPSVRDHQTIPPVVIIGVGNILLSDEGIGVHVVRALGRQRLTRRIELIDGGTGGLVLLNTMLHRERVIIVDAVSLRAPPASVFCWEPGDCRDRRSPFLSAHTEGVQDIVQAGRMLFLLPPILCIGVVPRDMTTPGSSLSRTLRRRLPIIARVVLCEAIGRRRVHISVVGRGILGDRKVGNHNIVVPHMQYMQRRR